MESSGSFSAPFMWPSFWLLLTPKKETEHDSGGSELGAVALTRPHGPWVGVAQSAVEQVSPDNLSPEV